MNLFDGVSELLGMGSVVIGIRPEYVTVASDGPVPGQVVRRERAGADAFVHVRTPYGIAIARVDSGTVADIGTNVALTFPAHRIVRFDPKSGEALA